MNLDRRRCAGFRLHCQKSQLQREYILAAARKQAQVFEVGRQIMPSDIDSKASVLYLRLSEVNQLNAQIKSKLTTDPGYQLRILLRFSQTDREAQFRSDAFEASMTDGEITPRELIAYFDACTSFSQFGALQHCLPHELIRKRLLNVTDDDENLVEILLSPSGGTLFNRWVAQELELALVKITSDAATFRHRLRQYWDGSGFLKCNDISDYVLGDAENRVLSQVERVVRQHQGDPERIRRQMSQFADGIESGQKRKRAAHDRLARILADRPRDRLLAANFVALSETTARHEDANRRFRMRFLRNMAKLLQQFTFDWRDTGIQDILKNCAGKCSEA